MQIQMFRQSVLWAPLLVTAFACNPADCQLPLWTGQFTVDGKTYEHTMVGTNPKLTGRLYSIIPVNIVPLVLTFDGTIVDPSDGVHSPVARVLGSPLFVAAEFPGHQEVGKTQYIDAYQRANFWNRIDSTHDFHVLLQQPPSVLHVPPIVVQRTASCPLQNSHGEWQVDWVLLNSSVRMALSAFASPSELTIFLLDGVNICNYENGGSTALGYHSHAPTIHSEGGGDEATYVVATYHRQPARNGAEDVSSLSHEVGEWLANPYGRSKAPAWMNGNKCKTALEIGDPLAPVATRWRLFEVELNDFTYHLQDLAFLSWFKREPLWNGSTANWWSFHRDLLYPPEDCNPN
jgi:hypothetical protein